MIKFIDEEVGKNYKVAQDKELVVPEVYQIYEYFKKGEETENNRLFNLICDVYKLGYSRGSKHSTRKEQ